MVLRGDDHECLHNLVGGGLEHLHRAFGVVEEVLEVVGGAAHWSLISLILA